MEQIVPNSDHSDKTSENQRVAKDLRALAGAIEHPWDAKDGLEKLGLLEVPGATGPVLALLADEKGLWQIDKLDAIKVQLRLLARAVEGGAVDLSLLREGDPEDAAHEASIGEDWTDEEIAQEVAPWPRDPEIDPLSGEPDPEPMADTVEHAEWLGRRRDAAVAAWTRDRPDLVRADVDPGELSDDDLLRALADDLMASKSALHRAAVTRLYDIAERLQKYQGLDDASFIMKQYIELESRVRGLETSVNDYVDMTNGFETEVANVVTGSAFMGDRVESCSKSILDLEERIDALDALQRERLDKLEKVAEEHKIKIEHLVSHVTELNMKAHEPFDFTSLVNTIDSIEKRISAHYDEQAKRVADLVGILDSVTRRVGGLEERVDVLSENSVGGPVLVSRVTELEKCALTKEELEAIRTGLAEG